ncbi:hypothetical protein T4E_7592 [Trichinella pseudospiralis]|uniref:Uncharacterized protein n=1 Tax=Trichinella pseudospiralis TaxID=6337 RepID=A0A0V0YFK4_TRIPS|nr:hypothetical protein T4E_7592 [Trichinella pseudospiralis]
MNVLLKDIHCESCREKKLHENEMHQNKLKHDNSA